MLRSVQEWLGRPSAPEPFPAPEQNNESPHSLKTVRTKKADSVIVKENGGLVTISPACDLVGEKSDEFITVVMDILDKGLRPLCFDLSAVKDVDDQGLGVFIVVARMCKSAEGSLSLLGLNSEILALFRSFRLLSHYTV